MKKLFLFLSITNFATGDDFSRFDAAVFPDYYYKGIMVEIQAEPDSGKSFEAFSLTVPVQVDSAFMVAPPGGNPKLLPVKDADGGKQIEIPESADPIRIFYFYSANRSENSVSFQYSLSAGITINDAHILIQEPLVAENFSISKSGSEKFEDPHGLTFHRYHIPELYSGELVSYSVSYSNPSGKTTMEVLQNLLSTDQPDMSGHEPVLSENVIQRHTLPSWQPLSVLGAFALAVGFLFQRKRKFEAQQKSDHNCTSCGTQRKSEDNYCAKCGKEL